MKSTTVSVGRFEGQSSKCGPVLRRAIARWLVPYVATIEPNWAEVEITFSRESGEVEAAWVNGPVHGTSTFSQEVLSLLPKTLLTGLWYLRVTNRGHRVELLVDRTVVHFENCEDGYVSQVEGEAFVVTYHQHFGEEGEVRTDPYTRAQLEDEFEWEGYRGQAVSVSYWPFGTEGEKTLPEQLAVAKQHHEACRRQAAELARRVAEAKAGPRTFAVVEPRPESADPAEWPEGAVERVVFELSAFPDVVFPSELPYTCFYGADGWPLITPEGVKPKLDPRMQAVFKAYPWTSRPEEWRPGTWVRFASSYDKHYYRSLETGLIRGLLPLLPTP